MDKKPFLVVDLLNIKDSDVVELKKFLKSNFNIDNILSTAEVLKYSNAIKRLLKKFLDIILLSLYLLNLLTPKEYHTKIPLIILGLY